MPRRYVRRKPAPVRDEMVAEALRGARGPVSAYELIDRLRDKATLAPQTMYRSLGRLIADGQAHRLESLNAFVACRKPHRDRNAAFAICDGCGSVEEFDEEATMRRLADWAAHRRFEIRGVTLELRGVCGDCAGAAKG